jgi:hypothetical protein
MSQRPAGEEREVRPLGGSTIDGAPVTYVVALAAVVAALSFVPFSVILAAGGSFPMSQGVYALVGWILGPVAGAIAAGIGRLIGVFLAPHTAGPVPLASVWGAVIAGFAAGAMALREKRRNWWIPLSVLFVVEFALFIGRAVLLNGVGVGVAVLNSIVNWSSIVLFVLPTRTLVARWLRSRNLGLVSAGLFLGTWMIAGISHLSVTVILYFLLNWPEEVWITLIPIIPVENLSRCLIGAVIGTGVIAGLRAIGLVKAAEAVY